MTLSLSSPTGARAIPSGRSVIGRLRPPSSKSITQRIFNMALLANQQVVVEHPLIAEDTELFLKALRALGFASEQKEDRIALVPENRPGEAKIQCGNNGTMLRFLTGSLTTIPGIWLLDGTARLRQRPVGPLVTALRALGAEIEYLEVEGYAPLRLTGGSLAGGSVELDARLSSQFASSLLMAATRADNEVVLHLKSLSSAPYLDLTIEILRSFGARCGEVSPSNVYRIEPAGLRGGRFTVEADFSAAAYAAAAALLTGGRVLLEGVRSDSKQGDRRFLEVLGEMGAVVDWRQDGVEVRGEGDLRAVDFDLSGMPDQAPTLAALAPFAAGASSIRNVGHLRIKESDRLAAITAELRKLGADVDERPDALIVSGTWHKRPPPAAETRIDPHGDHRIAMSLAVCGLRRPGVVILDAGVVAKSYPDFWNDLDSLLQR